MQILSRRNGESFLIGDDIRITVLSARGNQVRFGIHAPSHTSIHREEIYLQVQEADQPAGVENPPVG